MLETGITLTGLVVSPIVTGVMFRITMYFGHTQASMLYIGIRTHGYMVQPLLVASTTQKLFPEKISIKIKINPSIVWKGL